MTLAPAEQRLQELGVTDPSEIDLEAVAYDAGAAIRYRHLDGCEARIVGLQDKAIITVNSSSLPRRQRFSIAHELGHWHHHRGRCLMCRVEEIQPRSPMSPERTADGFAADLLMPDYLFRPAALRLPRLDFTTLRSIADDFDVSITAAAIRVVEMDHHPAMLICHSPKGRKWFQRPKGIPERWFPQQDLDAQSFAFGVQFGTDEEPRFPRKIGADAWFERSGADRFEIREQTIRVGPDKTLTLLLLDEEMLEDNGRSGWKPR